MQIMKLKSHSADGASFVLECNPKTFEILVDILDNYSNISGLKLNLKNAKFCE